MTDRSNRRLLLTMLLGSAAAIAFATSPPARAAPEGTKVGTAAATRPGVTGTPPAQERRIIEVGTNVLADERIVTTANSQAQLLFNDGSSFSVGPDSDIMIDKFVFDPATGIGEMSLSVGKGVFRFVGGKISKNSEVQVKTPTATVGIRGGIATIVVAPNKPVVANFLFGKAMTFAQNGVTVMTSRPGTRIEAPVGAPPSPPRPATQAELRTTMGQLEAPKKQTATAGDAARGGSAAGPAAQQQQASGGQQPPAGDVKGGDGPGGGVQVGGVQVGGGPGGGGPIGFGGPGGGEVSFANFLDSKMQISGFIEINSNLGPKDTFLQPLVFFNGGRGPGENGPAGPDQSAPEFFLGSFLLSQDIAPFDLFSSFIVSGIGSGQTAFDEFALLEFRLISSDFSSGNNILPDAFDFSTTGMGSRDSPNTSIFSARLEFSINPGAFIQATGSSTLIEPLFAQSITNRSATDGTQLNGYIAGLVQSRANGPAGAGVFTDGVFRNQNDLPANFLIETNSNLRIASAVANITSGGDLFGVSLGSTQGDNVDSIFFDDQRFALRAGITSEPSTFNGSNIAAAGSAKVAAGMITHNLVGINEIAIPSSTVFCTACNFMNWGWWMSDFEQLSSDSSLTPRRDRVRLATWVAGTLPRLEDIPTAGTASYSGQAIGNVINGTERYVAFGSFSKSWNFGTREGAATISNFDSKNVSFNTSSTNGREFRGALNTIASPGITSAALAGSFFQAKPSAPVHGVGGNFSFTANNYVAAGTFIAAQ